MKDLPTFELEKYHAEYRACIRCCLRDLNRTPEHRGRRAQLQYYQEMFKAILDILDERREKT